MEMRNNLVCPVCENQECQTFFELKEMPVSIGVQWPTKQEALACRKGDINLVFCPQCGFIWNSSFDLNRLEYSKRYDNSLDYSPHFEAYAKQLAQRLIDTYATRRKKVVELGSGKGHFLALLCELGENSGVGFDPSYEGERIKSPAAERITYINDFYEEKYTSYHGDLVCCRHVFEHVPDPLDFLSMVRRTIGEHKSTIVYFEVPNVRLILERLSVWDIIYEHCNYFSAESLGYVFQRCGFRPLDLRDAYSSQFLSMEARLDGEHQNTEAPDLTDLTALVSRFSESIRNKREGWAKKLQEFKANPRRTVIWGGGAKAVSFLNTLNPGDLIPYVVDINPHKQGLHIAGSGQQIVGPEFLRDYQPQTVILMNPVYRKEIQDQLNGMGLHPELLES